MESLDSFILRVDGLPDAMLSASADRPAEILGQKVMYAWKPILKSGKFDHPNAKFGRITFTRDDLQTIDRCTKEWMQEGGKPFVPMGHTTDPAKNVGHVLDTRVDGDVLWGLHQLVGSDAHLAAARNSTSVCVRRNFKTSGGKTLPMVLEHNAIVSDPVATGLGGFVALSRGASGPADEAVPVYSAAERNPTMPELTEQQVMMAREVLNRPDLHPEQIADNLIGALQCAVEDMVKHDEFVVLSRTQNEDLRTELARVSSERDNAIEMSREPVETPAELTDVYLSRSERILGMVQNGQLSPDRGKKLRAMCKGERGLSVVMLSRDAAMDAAPIDAFLDFIAETPGLKLGEQSGVQHITLGRTVPGEEQPENLPYQKMADRYNSAVPAGNKV